MSEGLHNIRKTIDKFTTQGPVSFPIEEAKVEYMYGAVICQEWANAALKNCYAQKEPWKFSQICSALYWAWLQEQRRSGKTVNVAPKLDNVVSIMWESQHKYGITLKCQYRNPKKYQKHFFGPKIRCWNCKEHGHTSNNCLKKEHNLKKVHNAISKNPKKANKIIFELC